jgi:nitrate reductase (NAD(P)H)
MQNGDVLSPDHGFPVRVIVPGFTAGRMVKWLKRIIVTTKESDSHYHYHDNRLLPSHVDAELANTEGIIIIHDLKSLIREKRNRTINNYSLSFKI